MKILYIISSINNHGGVARVLVTKANYLVENFGYEIVIVTENKGNFPLYFDFNPKIKFIDFELPNNKLKEILEYKNQLQVVVNQENPDFIITSNFAFKSFLIPYLLKTNVPIIFETHGSKYFEDLYVKQNIYHQFRRKIKVGYRNFLSKKFDFFIASSNESKLEWGIKNTIVFYNPMWFTVNELATLDAKKVITLARHTYEKGIDRLLLIWKKIVEKHPNWILEIYGEQSNDFKFVKLAQNLEITKNVQFYDATSQIIEKYKLASIYAMTSRFECFGMVLIEAMNCGLPVIAYDCPTGPAAIISNNEDGFLIEDENENKFIEKLDLLIENQEMRLKMGKKAHENVKKYNIETIMNQWNDFFESNKKS